MMNLNDDVMTAEGIVAQLIEMGTILAETHRSDDYKTGNRAVEKFNKGCYQLMRQDKELAIKVLSAAMKSDVDTACAIAAAYAWNWDILVDEAIAVLEEIEKRNIDKYASFQARLSLKQYRGEYPRSKSAPAAWQPKQEEDTTYNHLKTKEDFLNAILEIEKIIDEATDASDGETRVKETRNANKMFARLHEDLVMTKEVHRVLLECPRVYTRLSSAVRCLKLGIYIDKAEKVLEEIAKREEVGRRKYLTEEAERTLSVWRGEIHGESL